MYHVPDVLLEPREFIVLEFSVAGAQHGDAAPPTVDVQAIETDGQGDQLDLRLIEVPKEEPASAPKEGEEEKPVNVPEKHPRSSRTRDDWEDGVAYESLLSSDIHLNTKYRLRLANRDPAATARTALKLVVTERFESSTFRSESEILPSDFAEVSRVKPKVPGLKESAFIQGSRKVMETFKVASLSPFVPQSAKVYQAVFRTGPGTDDSFMKGLEFEVTEQSTQIFAQVLEYSGREDLFLSVYDISGGAGTGSRQVARSTLGKYANALGPVTLTKG